jgi:hypothetical protein
MTVILKKEEGENLGRFKGAQWNGPHSPGSRHREAAGTRRCRARQAEFVEVELDRQIDAIDPRIRDPYLQRSGGTVRIAVVGTAERSVEAYDFHLWTMMMTAR